MFHYINVIYCQLFRLTRTIYYVDEFILLRNG